MKQKLTPNIGIDFVSSTGDRITAFQLCVTRPDGRLEAHAVVDFTGNSITRHAATPSLGGRMAAIFRLANICRNRSVPQVFGRPLIPT